MGRATRHLHSFHLFGNVPARPTSELRSAIGAGIGRLLVSPCLALPHRDETTVIQAASFPPGVPGEARAEGAPGPPFAYASVPVRPSRSVCQPQLGVKHLPV
jgi:hypothetical protein